MQIIVDDTTHGVELYHLSILFQSLAGARGFAVPKPERAAASQTSTVGELSVTLNVDTSDATSAVEALADLIDRTGVKVDDVPPVTVSTTVTEAFKEMPEPGSFPLGASAVIEPPTTVNILPPATNDNLDSAGLPWDARIHAGSRERNTDGSWRVRRRPKGVEEAEWEATLARVTAELRDLMEIPVSPGAVADAAAEEALTDAEVDAFVGAVQGAVLDTLVNTDTHIEPGGPGSEMFVAPPITVAPPVVVAPPAIEPPVTAVAPPITTDAPKIETFAQVMTFLTARTPKDEAAKPAMVARVNEILAANGLTTLQQLGQRPDLIPQVMAQFTEAFGE